MTTQDFNFLMEMGKDNQEEEESTGVEDIEILEDADDVEELFEKELDEKEVPVVDDGEVESPVVVSDDEITDSKS